MMAMQRRLHDRHLAIDIASDMWNQSWLCIRRKNQPAAAGVYEKVGAGMLDCGQYERRDRSHPTPNWIDSIV
jgi:hypothetical protein